MKNLSFKKIIALYTIGSLLGWVLETIFTSIKYQHYIVKKGMIFGVFKPLYGAGIVLFYLVYLLIKNRNYSKIKTFFIGIVVGCLYEYGASLFETYVLHTNTWDYSKFNFNINGRVYLPYTIIWGLLLTFSIYYLFPLFDKFYNKYIKIKLVSFLLYVLTVFMSINIVLTTLVFLRYGLRYNNISPITFIGEVIDHKYNDDYINKTFPRLRGVK